MKAIKDLFKRNHGIFKEVIDMREIVYDFRRRSTALFENYRCVSYTPPDSYNLETLKTNVLTKVDSLHTANAIDAGNADCLVEFIFGPIRSSVFHLEKQGLDHEDFYSRQANNMEVHCTDLSTLINFCKEKENELLEEHRHTLKLWKKYYRFSENMTDSTMEVSNHE